MKDNNTTCLECRKDCKISTAAMEIFKITNKWPAGIGWESKAWDFFKKLYELCPIRADRCGKYPLGGNSSIESKRDISQKYRTIWELLPLTSKTNTLTQKNPTGGKAWPIQ